MRIAAPDMIYITDYLGSVFCKWLMINRVRFNAPIQQLDDAVGIFCNALLMGHKDDCITRLMYFMKQSHDIGGCL